jgi:hypothetical protein
MALQNGRRGNALSILSESRRPWHTPKKSPPEIPVVECTRQRSGSRVGSAFGESDERNFMITLYRRPTHSSAHTTAVALQLYILNSAKRLYFLSLSPSSSTIPSSTFRCC